MTYTKAELVTALESDEGFEKSVAKDMVDQIFEEIRTHLESGEEVKLSGFGNFEIRDKKKRPGRNPKTGAPKTIAARRVVTFKVGQKLKAKIQAYKGPASLANTQNLH